MIAGDRIYTLGDLGDAQYAIAVRRDGGAVVGFLNLGPSRDEDLPGVREIYCLYVLASHHDKGIGKALLDAGLVGDVYVVSPRAATPEQIGPLFRPGHRICVQSNLELSPESITPVFWKR